MTVYNAIIFSVCLATIAQARPLAEVKQGQLLIQQAEQYSRRNARASHSWERVHGKRKDIPDHLLAAPADNTIFEPNNKDFEKKSPVVEYDLTFENPGTYYIWIRGKGEAGGASLAMGMDDALIRSTPIGFFPYKFAWRGTYQDESRLMLNIAESGNHVLQFWMVEDGFCFDQFLITADPKYQPPSEQ